MRNCTEKNFFGSVRLHFGTIKAFADPVFETKYGTTYIHLSLTLLYPDNQIYGMWNSFSELADKYVSSKYQRYVEFREKWNSHDINDIPKNELEDFMNQYDIELTKYKPSSNKELNNLIEKYLKVPEKR